MNNSHWFSEARFGLFVHYGLYSLLGRGEWVMNREGIEPQEYARLANDFTAESFDADAICDLAVRAGMRYIVFTTMHHEGFRLYDTRLSDFNSVRACGRDLTAEVIAAARRRNLKIGLYHSLNNWMDRPDAVDALERPEAYEQFLRATFERLSELVSSYKPIDILWYDGWWPFDAEGWQSERMNCELRAIQPQLIFNGRNGLPGDFATPEGHLSAPTPWRPWEGCLSLNGSWGYSATDNSWKSPRQVVELLATCAQGCGNLLLNVGPRGDGAMPAAAVATLERVGQWLEVNGEAVFETEPFTFDLQLRGTHRGDWTNHGPVTLKGNFLYLLATNWPGSELAMMGAEGHLLRVTLLGGGEIAFTQNGPKVVLTGLPLAPPDEVCPVFRLEFAAPPSLYWTGGMRPPAVPHPHYDPCPSDILAGGLPG